MFCKFMILNLMTVFTLFACSQNDTIDISNTKIDKNVIRKDSIHLDSAKNLLLSCKGVNLSLGSLQSLQPNQNKEIFLFGQCLNNDTTFDAIWVLNKSYEKRLKEENLDSIYASINDETLITDDYKVLLFQTPLKPVDDPLLDDPYTFPCTVRVYVVSNSTSSEMVGTYKIKSWTEYVQLQYRCVYTLKFT